MPDDPKQQAAAALADLAVLAPMMRNAFKAFANDTNGWNKAFPAPQHGHPDYVPGQSFIPDVIARFDAIVAGAAVAATLIEVAK